MFWKKAKTNAACTFPFVFDSTQQQLKFLISGAYAAIVSFLGFAMIQFRDGPFIRPHPAFWRIALGLNLLYELALVFLLFQDLASARGMMKLIDSNLGVELPEKNYAENCEFTARNIWVRQPFLRSPLLRLC